MLYVLKGARVYFYFTYEVINSTPGMLYEQTQGARARREGKTKLRWVDECWLRLRWQQSMNFMKSFSSQRRTVSVVQHVGSLMERNARLIRYNEYLQDRFDTKRWITWCHWWNNELVLVTPRERDKLSSYWYVVTHVEILLVLDQKNRRMTPNGLTWSDHIGCVLQSP